MKILYSKVSAQSPFAADVLGGVSLAGPPYTCGAFSIEHFADPNLATLSHTHGDAQGWLNYLDQFFTENFWFEDSGVQIWEYLPTYDDWQDRYGLDGCLSVYHSGHGGMDGNGVFYAPLGGNWATRVLLLSLTVCRLPPIMPITYSGPPAILCASSTVKAQLRPGHRQTRASA